MMKTIIEAVLEKLFWAALAFVIASPAVALSSIPERANADQAWSATYRGLIQQLGNVWMDGALEGFTDQTGLDAEDARLALRYLRNYPVSDLRVEHVLVRYPHYNRKAVEQDLQRLAALNLIKPKTDLSWRIAAKGVAAINAWYDTAAQHTAAYETTVNPIGHEILAMLDKIVSGAAAINDDDINISLYWRMNHRFRVSADAPVLLKIDERIWDYVAFINDNAHYRIDRYMRIGDGGIIIESEPTPLAKELFAAMRSGEDYALDRCADHQGWRVGVEACESALKEMQELGWIIETADDVYAHSKIGAALFRKIETLTDNRLYSTWADVTNDEYERYMRLLEVMPGFVDSIIR